MVSGFFFCWWDSLGVGCDDSCQAILLIWNMLIGGGTGTARLETWLLSIIGTYTNFDILPSPQASFVATIFWGFVSR